MRKSLLATLGVFIWVAGLAFGAQAASAACYLTPSCGFGTLAAGGTANSGWLNQWTRDPYMNNQTSATCKDIALAYNGSGFVASWSNTCTQGWGPNNRNWAVAVTVYTPPDPQHLWRCYNYGGGPVNVVCGWSAA